MAHDVEPLGQGCPYCGRGMAIARMGCEHCGVAVEGAFAMSMLAGLPIEHQRFIEMFVLAGGNLKEIAEQVGVSYPTIRSRLDKVIDALRGEIAKTRRVRGDLLDAVGPSTERSDERGAGGGARGGAKGGAGRAEDAARIIKEI